METGAAPPQESGLLFNSWSGKHHQEMRLWHQAWLPVGVGLGRTAVWCCCSSTLYQICEHNYSMPLFLNWQCDRTLGLGQTGTDGQILAVVPGEPAQRDERGEEAGVQGPAGAQDGGRGEPTRVRQLCVCTIRERTLCAL